MAVLPQGDRFGFMMAAGTLLWPTDLKIACLREGRLTSRWPLGLWMATAGTFEVALPSASHIKDCCLPHLAGVEAACGLSTFT